MSSNISIEWESSGYSVLKNLNSTVLGVFCEFIDNSIQSFKNDGKKIASLNPNKRLRVTIDYTGEEIIISDNAGGINKENFDRALKPANRNINVEGLNEFGLGMKYAAVWISNEWELISSSVEEEVQRSVVFNYQDVVKQNLKSLPVKEIPASREQHGTTVILRQLEKKHVYPWQKDYLVKKLASIYRNYLRSSDQFYDDFIDQPIDIIFDNEPLKWEEFGFLRAPWWKELQVNHNEDSQVYEWKYKFDWLSIPYTEEVQHPDGSISVKESGIEVAGFIGILPDGSSKGKNGFVLFRRGRAVEGVVDQRVFPIDISGSQARDFRHIRLYGELHFKNVEVSFDKSKLSINKKRRDEIFAVIATMLKKIQFPENKGTSFDLIAQASKHRANFSLPTGNKAIEQFNAENSYVDAFTSLKAEQAATAVFDTEYEKILEEDSKEPVNNKFEKIPDQTYLIGSNSYLLKVEFTENKTVLYNVKYDELNREIRVIIDLSNSIFRENRDYFKIEQFNLIIKFIQCLAISEVKGKLSGNETKHMRFAINAFAKVFLE